MTGKLQFLFVSSFLMGIFAGAYVYVTFFAPQYDADLQSGNALDQDAFVIEGEMYGGCQRLDACASFQLIRASNYAYSASISAERSEGKLPGQLVSALRNSLSEDMLIQTQQRINSTSCRSFVDGVDYRYLITKDGTTYELDTCTTALAYDEDLQSLLLDAWFAMENPDAVEDYSEFELGDWIRDRFQNPPEN